MTTSPADGRGGVLRATLRVLLAGRMLVALVMGFVSGLPLLLTLSVLQAWMTHAGVDLTTIGLFTLVGLPYTLKFLWAPLLDRYTPRLLGRRRGWLLAAQLALMASISALGFSDPAAHIWLLALSALLVAFFSASQDIVIDAYRRESLSEEELGLGASLYVGGYRAGMLLAGGGGLILADVIPFRLVYQVMAALMLIGVITTLAAPEPAEAAGKPRTMREAVVEPFRDFFTRSGAGWILLFILLYKIGDTMASAMTTPFYLELGFSNTEIGSVVKLYGFWAIIVGGIVGGMLILHLGIYHSLWLFGILQAVSTAGFAVLASVGYSLPGLAAVITFENFSGGLGTAAYLAFMASLTNRRFTATQYALLTSLMGVPRVLLSAPTGWLAETLGWVPFFLFCTAVAVPGLLILVRFAGWTRPREEVADAPGS